MVCMQSPCYKGAEAAPELAHGLDLVFPSATFSYRVN